MDLKEHAQQDLWGEAHKGRRQTVRGGQDLTSLRVG